MTYTREQILSMPAGKEMDKIAAKAVQADTAPEAITKAAILAMMECDKQ